MLKELKCAPAPTECLLLWQRPLTLLFCHADSLANNGLCGVQHGRGYHTTEGTTEGITKLCDALKGSAVTSLKCAVPPRSVCFCVSAH